MLNIQADDPKLTIFKKPFEEQRRDGKKTGYSMPFRATRNFKTIEGKEVSLSASGLTEKQAIETLDKTASSLRLKL